MYTIGQLAKKFRVSRGTLLHYDRIGLLRPHQRSKAGYRLYSKEDVAYLKRIRLYRQTGLSLAQISDLLKPSSIDQTTVILESRLQALNREMQTLQQQQQVVVSLLGQGVTHSRVMTVEMWSRLLQEAGLDDAGMAKWHQAFEQTMPEAHQDFLESLGLKPEAVEKIRRLSRV